MKIKNLQKNLFKEIKSKILGGKSFHEGVMLDYDLGLEAAEAKELKKSEAADPVTEMSTSGLGSRQYFSRKCDSVAAEVV